MRVARPPALLPGCLHPCATISLMGVVLTLKGVEKAYGLNGQRVEAVCGIDLEVAAGEFLAIMGPSGCGKSTLLHLMGGMDRPDRGEIWLDELPLHRLPEEQLIRVRRRSIGFVFQFFYLLPTMTVQENVELPLLLAGIQDGGPRVRRLLERVGLAHRLDAFPTTLSGGEMQRAALARALVQRPRLVIADEPTGNLDSENGRRVLALLQSLAEEHGSAVIMATHSNEAAVVASRVLHMKDGLLSP